jgi:hypothetical protein
VDAGGVEGVEGTLAFARFSTKVRRAADSGTLATFAEDNKGLPEMRAVLTT